MSSPWSLRSYPSCVRRSPYLSPPLRSSPNVRVSLAAASPPVIPMFCMCGRAPSRAMANCFTFPTPASLAISAKPVIPSANRIPLEVTCLYESFNACSCGISKSIAVELSLPMPWPKIPTSLPAIPVLSTIF